MSISNIDDVFPMNLDNSISNMSLEGSRDLEDFSCVNNHSIKFFKRLKFLIFLNVYSHYKTLSQRN